MIDKLKFNGTVCIKKTNTETGQIETYKMTNLVVTAGKTLIMSRLQGATSNVINYIAVGTGNTAPALTDTTLETELEREAITVSGGTASTNTITYVANFGVGVGTGAWREAGLFNESSGGTMLSRVVYDVINKGAADSMEITWVIDC